MYTRILVCLIVFVASFAATSLPRFLKDKEVSASPDDPRASLLSLDGTRLTGNASPPTTLTRRLEDLLKTATPNSENREELEAILSQLVEKNPAYVISLFREGKLHRVHEKYLEKAVALQITRNPSYLSSIPRQIDNWVGEKIWQVALTEVSKNDPKLALRHFDQVAVLDVAVLDGIYEQWQKADAQAAWNDYWESRYTQQRLDLLAPPKLFTSWLQADPQSAYQWVKETPMLDHLKRGLVKTMMESLQPQQGALLESELSSLNALGTELGLGNYDTRLQALHLANQDPEAALDLASEISQPYLNKDTVSDIIESVRRTDPELAIELASQVAPRLGREEAYADYAKDLASDNPVEALEWARELPDQSARGSAISSVFATWAKEDPTGALGEFAVSKSLFDSEVHLHRWTDAHESTLFEIIKATPEDDFLKPEIIDHFSKIIPQLVDYSQSSFKDLLETHISSEAALEAIFGSNSSTK